MESPNQLPTTAERLRLDAVERWRRISTASDEVRRALEHLDQTMKQASDTADKLANILQQLIKGKP